MQMFAGTTDRIEKSFTIRIKPEADMKEKVAFRFSKKLEMISCIEKKLGGVDILINNAAVDLSNLFHLKTAEEFRRTMEVNVVGAFNCSKRVYRYMLEKEYGRIINISSTNRCV